MQTCEVLEIRCMKLCNASLLGQACGCRFLCWCPPNSDDGMVEVIKLLLRIMMLLVLCCCCITFLSLSCSNTLHGQVASAGKISDNGRCSGVHMKFLETLVAPNNGAGDEAKSFESLGN